MRNLEDLKTILQEHKEELSRKYGVIEVGIFGSYVKNKQAEGSDVDILVDFREPVDLLTFVHLKNHLSDLLGINEKGSETRDWPANFTGSDVYRMMLR